MAQDANDPEPPKGGRRFWIWSKPLEPGKPAQTSQDSSQSQDASSRQPSPNSPSKLNPLDFQANFPEAQGGRPTISAAAKTIKKEDFLHVHEMPCARQGLITGIAGGAAIGGIRFVWSGSVGKGANWAVGAFAAVSLLSYEFCQYKRRVEKYQMRRAVEVVSTKREEKRKETEEKKKQADEETRAKKPWYRVW